MNVFDVAEGPERERWEAYLGAKATAVTDLPAWQRVIAAAYGLRSWSLAAESGDRLVGALWLCETRHPAFGHYLTTAPFGNDGGLFVDDDEARDALAAAARGLADRLGVDYLVIRSRGQALAGFQVDSHYSTVVLGLEGGAESVWRERLGPKTRNQVRRGTKEGFTVEAGPAQLDAFYDVLHRHMRALGSPSHSRRFYESVLAQLGDRAEFLVVRDGARPAAAALLFWVNGTAQNLHTVSLREFNRRCANYLLYWRMIETSCARGCLRFDMGRSAAESSNLAFKTNWGGKQVPLFYNYYLRRLDRVPCLDPRNPRYRLPIAVWRRLPLAVTKRLGPRLMPGLL